MAILKSDPEVRSGKDLGYGPRGARHTSKRSVRWTVAEAVEVVAHPVVIERARSGLAD